MIRGLLTVALIGTLTMSASQANAARPLLAELLARAPVAEGEPAMSALALEACLRRATELDRIGPAIDTEVAAIDRLAAEGIFLQRQLATEMSMLGGYDQSALDDFQHRLIRHDEIAKKFKAEFPVYQEKQKAYDAAVVEFDRDCAQGFAAGDLAAVKARLGTK